MKFLKTFMILLAALAFLSANVNLNADNSEVFKLKFPPLNKIQKPELLKAETNNGIKLRVIKDNKLPLINLSVVFRGGFVYDPTDKIGLSSIMAELIRNGGATNLEANDLEKILDLKGITINILTDTDYYLVRLTCLLDNFEEAISILSRLLTEPAFPADKLDELKARYSSAISRRNDDANTIVIREAMRLLFGKNSPFAPVQEYEHIDNITRDEIIKQYRAFFAPANMTVGIVGPVGTEEAKALFEKYLGTWNNTAQIPPYPTCNPQPPAAKVYFVQKPELNQTYILMGHIGIKYDPSLHAKFELFNKIFASGMDSRLFNRVRTQMGLTYTIEGGISTNNFYPGKVGVYTFTKCESTIKAINAINEEITRIRTEKVTDKELQTAKEAFLNSYVFEFSDPSDYLKKRMLDEFYGLDENFSEQLIENVKKTTADDILQTAQTYMQPEKFTLIAVGNKEKLDGDLAQYGTVKDLDITIKPPALKEIIPPPTPASLEKGTQIITQLLNQKYKGYKTLKSMENDGVMQINMQGQAMEFPLKVVTLFPDKKYMEISVMGRKILQVINGNNGAAVGMSAQKKLLGEDEIAKQRFGEVYFILNTREKYQFQYLEEKDVAGQKYDLIYATDAGKNNNWMKLYISKQSGLIEITEKMEDTFAGTLLTTGKMSDFRDINGIPIPFKVEISANGKPLQAFIFKDSEVNIKVDTALFNLEAVK